MFAAATVFAYGCSDNFDDSALWKDIDGMYKSLNELKAQVTTMQQQLDALAAVVSGGAVTSITQDADGHYVLSYKDADNVEHTIDIATMDDANTQPIIGMKADGEIYYWTVTTGGKTSWLLDTDGAKIPVTGRTPEIGVDDQGYWTLFGKRITDASGNLVKAEGKSASVITKVEMKDDGTVVFTLGDGVQVTAQVQNGFNVLLSVEPRTVVTDVAQPLVITYTLVGETETSVLTVEKAEGLAAKLDEQAKTITVTFPDGFEEGRLVVMFYDGADNVIIKPLIFTTMEGAPTGIRNADDLKAFASAVNAGKSLAKYTIDGEVCPMTTSPVMPCTVAIFTIGLMLSFSKRINLFVVLFLCHWSLIGFSKVYFFGIPEDLLLASALVPALYLFFKEYIDVNFRRNAKPDLRVMNMLLLAMCSGLGVFFAATIWQQLV